MGKRLSQSISTGYLQQISHRCFSVSIGVFCTSLWACGRPRIWFGTLPLLWNSFIVVAIYMSENSNQKMWRRQIQILRTSVTGCLVLPVSGKSLPISVREIGISVLFILHVDIINILLHRCPPGDLGEVPGLDSPVYCLTLVYIFKYILPSCAQEKLLGPSVWLLLSCWRLGLRGNSKMTQNSFSRLIFLP